MSYLQNRSSHPNLCSFLARLQNATTDHMNDIALASIRNDLNVSGLPCNHHHCHASVHVVEIVIVEIGSNFNICMCYCVVDEHLLCIFLYVQIVCILGIHIN